MRGCFLISGIYKIENLITHEVYIGQSKDISLRFKQHMDCAKNNVKGLLYYAMRKYGVENFSFEIIKITYDLDLWERFFIYWYDSCNRKFGYNLTSGGQAGNRRFDDFTYTDEIKLKMKQKSLERWKDPEYRQKVIKFQNLGRKSEKFKKLRSEATSNMWKTGKFDKQKEKLSKHWMGVKKIRTNKVKDERI